MSARDFDSQLLESVSVRRRRLRDALLHGAMRSKRSADELLGKVVGGVALVAVLCAGCVGWSFVSHRLMHRPAAAPGAPGAPASSTAPSTDPSAAPSPVHSAVPPVPSSAGRTSCHDGCHNGR